MFSANYTVGLASDALLRNFAIYRNQLVRDGFEGVPSADGTLLGSTGGPGELPAD